MNKRTSLITLAAIMFAGTAAQAADLAPPPPPAPEIRPAATDWTGPYLGAVLGGTCMDTEYDLLLDTAPKDGNIDTIERDLPLNGCGLQGGLLAGFNFQVDNMVFGLEGDWTWGSKTGKHADYYAGVPERGHYKIKWQTTLRARLGVLATDKTLFYLTGGFSWLRGMVKQTQPATYKFSRTHFGYTVGGGIEHAITENVHLRAEYLYSTYNDKTYGRFVNSSAMEPDVDVDLDLDNIHTFRAGVTWNFPVSTW